MKNSYFWLVFLFVYQIASFISVDPETKRLVDEDGRERYFHGLNVIYKSPPWLPLTNRWDPQLSFVEKDAASLNEWGLNIIRLGMMWPGAEPEQGKFDQDFMKQVQWIIDMAYTYNISTLLDMHQDCLSQLYCGEGAPEWAAKVDDVLFNTFPEPLGSPFARDPTTGWPSPEDCNKHEWASYQWTWAAAQGYQRLYDAVADGGMREEAGEFWSFVADWFKESEAVVGLELINEPFAGNVWVSPELLIPWEADRISLQPFYDTIVPMIRQKNKNHLIYFEPVTWSGQPYFSEAKVGFDHAPGGVQYANLSVLSYHYYDPPNFGDKLTYFQRRTDAAVTLNVASMVTEFNVGGNFSDMTDTINIIESFQTSWIGWEYKAFAGSLPNGTCTGCGAGPWNPDGSPNTDMIRHLSRTYAQAVGGQTLDSSFDQNTGFYRLSYKVKKSCRLPTEIYFNQALFYETGFSCDTQPEGIAECILVSKNHLEVHLTNNAEDGQILTILLSKK